MVSKRKLVIAEEVHRMLIEAMDELTTATMDAADQLDLNNPYDRGYIDGIMVVAQAMREGYDEALARAQKKKRKPDSG